MKDSSSRKTRWELTVAHDVFISYAEPDKAVADSVCAELEARHIRCWMAPRDIPPGRRYAEAITEALHASRVFVLVFSAAASDSVHVEREVDRAVTARMAVLPLRVEDVTPSDSMDYYLAGQQWLDAFTPPIEEHLARLGSAVEALLEQQLTREYEQRGLSRGTIARDRLRSWVRRTRPRKRMPKGELKTNRPAKSDRPPMRMGIASPSMGAKVRESEKSLERFEDATRWWMLGFSLAVIPLLVGDLLIAPTGVWGTVLETLTYALWTIFALEYGIRFWLARDKRRFFVRNILDFLLVVIPVFRPLRAVQAIMRLFRTTTALLFVVRAIKASRKALMRHGVVYALVIAAFVAVAGVILVRVFESHHSGSTIKSLTDAVWWTVETLFTAGADTAWPASRGAQIVRILLVLIGLGLFGLITATLASWLVEAEDEKHAKQRNEELQRRLAQVVSKLGHTKRPGRRRTTTSRKNGASRRSAGSTPSAATGQTDAAADGLGSVDTG